MSSLLLRCRHALAAALLGVALLVAGTACAWAQRIIVFNVDTTNFPVIDADIYVMRDDGSVVRNPDVTDFQVHENGVGLASVVSVTCGQQDVLDPMSAVVVCDRSGSVNIGEVKGAAAAFVRSVVFDDLTRVAVTGFHNQAVMAHDFSNDVGSLLHAIGNIDKGGGTEYDAAFLDPLAGGIPMLTRRPSYIPRVMVFLTDGSPNVPPDVPRIIAAAQAAGVKIYVVTLGVPMTSDLATIAAATGGGAYGNVRGGRELESLFASIALREQKLQPCHIQWESGPACGLNSNYRTAQVIYTPWPDTAAVSYVAPAGSAVRTTTDTSYLWFGAVPPGSFNTRTLTLTVQSGSITVQRAKFDPPGMFSVTDWGGSPPPFTLDAGEKRTLTIRFDAPDSAVHVGSVVLETDNCPIAPVTLAGGIWNRRAAGALRLLSPLGGEVFDGCDSVAIRWSGVPPTERVRIEYSAFDGDTWHIITDSAANHVHQWHPPSAGPAYRVRISLASYGMADTIHTLAGGGSRPITNGMQALEAALTAPSSVAAEGGIIYFNEPTRHTVRLVDPRTGTISTIAGTGTAGYSGDNQIAAGAQLNTPSAVAAVEGTLYIADELNHCVRAVNLQSGIITTIAGNGTAGYGGDDGPAHLAQLSRPCGLAATRGRLFISDSGNHRIRSIDLGTGIIRTVWDEGVATALAVRSAPSGTGDTVYFVRVPQNDLWKLPIPGFVELFRTVPSQAGSPDAAPAGLAVMGDDLLVADRNRNTVRAFARHVQTDSAVAGTGVPGFAGEGSPALSAQMQMPAGLALDNTGLYIADAGNNRIRVVRRGAALRTDQSRSTFMVNNGRMQATVRNNTVGMGAIGLGAVVDSLLVQAICNTGDQPFLLDSIEIIGAHAGDFGARVASSWEPLMPGECRTLEIRFQPGALGPRTARLVLHTRCAGTDTVALMGTGATPCMFTIRSSADAGLQLVGSPKDTLLKAVICNENATELRGTLRISPADGSFSLAGSPDYSLAPGQCLDVAIRFHPTTRGISSATLSYGLPRACGDAVTVLQGRGYRPATLQSVVGVTFTDRLCDPWPRDTVLTITNTGDFPLSVTAIALENNNEGFSIRSALPSSTDPLVLAPDSTATVALRLYPLTAGPKTATLRITSNDPASPFDVPVAARRDSAGITLSASLVTFDGLRPPGDYPLTEPLTVRNTGTVPVTITSASFTGGTPGAFRIAPGSVPVTIAPGESTNIFIEAIAPTAGPTLSARLRLEAEPACDVAVHEIPVIETGMQPAIVVSDIQFPPLRCPAPGIRDTIMVIGNPGALPLTITGITAGGANPGSFVVSAGLPLVIEPGGTASIHVRFVPPGMGSFTASITISSNAGSGDSIVTFTGRRESIGLESIPTFLDFGPTAEGAETLRSVLLISGGTAGLVLDLQTSTGEFVVQGSSRVRLNAGDSLQAMLRFSGMKEGEHVDTLIVADLECGVMLRIPLTGRIVANIRTVVRLPKDSAQPGAHVVLPLTMSAADPPAFRNSGAQRFRTTIAFNGLLLVPDSARRASITASAFDRSNGEQRLTIEGSYNGSDTLALLFCSVPSNSSGTTALRFMDFAWNTDAVQVDTMGGLFTAMDGCGSGMQFTARISGAKINPHPLHGEGTLTFELGEAHTIRITVHDILGRPCSVLAETYMAQGFHSIPIPGAHLPSGLYRVVIGTPFGSTSVPMVVR